MGYFKPKNMRLLEHGSNKKNFKPTTQEHNICKYSSNVHKNVHKNGIYLGLGPFWVLDC